MNIEEMSDLDLAYLEGFAEKCAEAGVDPEPLLADIVDAAKATDVKEAQIDTIISKIAAAEKKPDIDAIIEKIAAVADKKDG